jgi:urease accessory protein
MLDAAPVLMQRARGRAAVTLGLSRGATRIERLHQSGSAKAFLPNVHGPMPEVVFLNTAGGLTGGDVFAYEGRLGPGASATLTTQTAERAYRSAGGAAEMTVDLEAGAGPRSTGSRRRRSSSTARRSTGARPWRSTATPRSSWSKASSSAAPRWARRWPRSTSPTAARSPATAARPDRAPAAHRRHPRPPLPRDAGAARAIATVILAAPARRTRSAPSARARRTRHRGRGLGLGRPPRRPRAGPDGWPLRRLVARVLTILRGGPLPRVWQV